MSQSTDSTPVFGATPMPSVDFLPSWYPKYLRWKAIVRVHLWMLAVTVIAVGAIGMGAWSEVA
ncbi:MAG: hypothetical protein AAF656_09550, partial [Planctomycetota bacterium]